MRIAACVKWVDTRPEVDSLTGEVRTDPRSRGASAADQAAVELACRMAETWGGALQLVTGGPAGADAMLRELGAVGATRLTRVALDGVVDSAWTAVSLAVALRDVDVIVCGDHSLDRGSGSVPAFVAHALGSAQALGLTTVDLGGTGEVVATRRIGFGRAERLRVTAPAVISVEGSVAALRRAPLGRVLSAADMPIEVIEPVELPAMRPEHTEPLRPRTHRLAAPTGASALRPDRRAHRRARRPHAAPDGDRRPRGCGRPDRRAAPHLGLPRVTHLGDLTTADLAAESGRRLTRTLVVPVGSLEQHGPHLPLDTDTRIAVAVAEALASGDDGLVVAPAIAIGASGEHQSFVGTLSIGQDGIELVAIELVRSADAFDGVVLLNAHGGNGAALARAVERLHAEARHVALVPCTVEGGDAHAGHTETSILLHLCPDAVDMARAIPGDRRPWRELAPVVTTEGVAAVSPTGVLGDPTTATASDGAALFGQMVDRARRSVEGWRR